MGECKNCGKKILYNKYKRYRRTILCLECYSTRLERKAAKKVIRRRRAKKIEAPIEKEEVVKNVGLTITAPVDENETSD